VTLLELVQAYAALANGGVFRPVSVTLDGAGAHGARRVYSAEAASLVANILADADARALEFGRDSVLAFPVQTAVKTGTSNDFRDAWAVGFNYRFTVGVWMGNLDQTPTDGVTGSIGPALLLRSVFAELTRDAATRPLYLSSKLVRAAVCVPMPLRDSSAGECLQRAEWFVAGSEARALANNAAGRADGIRLRQPTPGLQLAYDPRIPQTSQVFEFALQGVEATDRVRWTVDGRAIDEVGATHRWRVTRGDHRVAAEVWQGGELVASLDETVFHVK
jgi:penicillin-binding protein 1C